MLPIRATTRTPASASIITALVKEDGPKSPDPDISGFSRNFNSYFSVSQSQWRNDNLDRAGSKDDQTVRNHGQTERNPGQSAGISSMYHSDHYEPLKWRTDMEMNKGVEVGNLSKMTIASVRHTGPYKGDEKLFDGLFKKLFAWAGPRELLSRPDMKTVTVYHDDPEITEEQNLRLSVL